MRTDAFAERPSPSGRGLGEGLTILYSLTGFLKLGFRLANEIRLSQRERKKECCKPGSEGVIFLCLILLLAACKSPEPAYYTLSALDGPALHGKKLTLKIERPAIDVTLDRPQMLRMDSRFHITYDNAALWSEPLDKMIERVLAQDMEKRLPGSVAVTESGEMEVPADYIIDLDIRQFGTSADGRAILQALMLIRTPKVDGSPEPVMLSGARAASGKQEAEALSELLGYLSDQIAERIRNVKLQK